jgi:hypothetical protein
MMIVFLKLDVLMNGSIVMTTMLVLLIDAALAKVV